MLQAQDGLLHFVVLLVSNGEKFTLCAKSFMFAKVAVHFKYLSNIFNRYFVRKYFLLSPLSKNKFTFTFTQVMIHSTLYKSGDHVSME